MSKRSCHPYHIFESIEMAPKLLQEIFDDQGLCEQLAEIVAEKDIRAVVCVGTGSSYLAAYSQAFAVKELIGIFSEAINSTDFRLFCPAYLDEHTLVVVNSHSGKSPGDVETETIAKGRGAYVVAVTDIEGTPLAQEADFVLLGPGGKKPELPSTRTYATALYRFFIFLARWAGFLGKAELSRSCLEELGKLPAYCRDLLDRYMRDGDAIAERLASLNSTVFICYGTNLSTALECAMGTTQASKRPSFGYVLEEYLHGPIQGVPDNCGAVLLAVEGPGRNRIIDFGKLCATLGMSVFTLVPENRRDCVEVGEVLTYPPIDIREAFTPVFLIMPFWVIGYYLTLRKGGDPDMLSMEDPRFIAADIASFKLKYA